MNPRRQRFADLVLQGRPASHAYREAGFSPKTVRSAEVEASKLLRNPEIEAYMEARRVAAAERAEITLAGVLHNLNAIGTDPEMPPQVRVNALAEVARRLPTAAGAAPIRIEVNRPFTGNDEQDAAIIARASLDAVIDGRIPPETGRIIAQHAEKVFDTTSVARIIREAAPYSPASLAAKAAGQPSALEQPKSDKPTLPHPRRPVWREPQEATGAGGQCSPRAPEQHEHQKQHQPDAGRKP